MIAPWTVQAGTPQGWAGYQMPRIGWQAQQELQRLNVPVPSGFRGISATVEDLTAQEAEAQAAMDLLPGPEEGKYPPRFVSEGGRDFIVDLDIAVALVVASRAEHPPVSQKQKHILTTK